VASDLQFLAEIVSPGNTGILVRPGDKVAFARESKLLLDSALAGRRLGEAARADVHRRFSVESMVDRFVGLYESFAS
jgi:glycosyltransferase involved in cell wall biosynthesis